MAKSTGAKLYLKDASEIQRALISLIVSCIALFD